MSVEVSTPSLIPTLPGSTYVDEAVFRAEQERIFEQMWFCAIRSADLDKAGAWQTVQIRRESVLISRTRKGQIRGFYNICRHRGVKLCMEEKGEAARSLQCPYHAWTYDFEGKLIAAPNLTKMPDIDRDEYGLVKVHIREYLGYVWVCLADEPPSFEEDVMGAIADRTIVECDWLYLPSVVESGKDVSASVELFHRVNQQDFDACERCQPAMGSKVYAKGGVLVPSEHHIGAFHDWVQEMIGDVTPGS